MSENKTRRSETVPTRTNGSAVAIATIRAVLCDASLSPGQKVVLAGVISQSDWCTRRVWASYRQLREAYGGAMATIRGALEAGLAGGYLERAGTGRRGAACYRVSKPASASPTEALDRPETVGPALQPVKRLSEKSASSSEAVEPGQRFTLSGSSASPTEAILNLTNLKDPPTPPANAGGCVCDSPGSETDITPNHPNEAVVAAWEKAYRDAESLPMPASWERRLRRDMNQKPSSIEVFSTVTPAAIRSGARLAEEKGRTFGIGWVLHGLRAEARHCHRSHAKRGTGLQAASPPASVDSEQERRDRSMAHFRGLPESVQAQFRQQARMENRFIRRDDLVDVLAARLSMEEASGDGPKEATA